MNGSIRIPRIRHKNFLEARKRAPGEQNLARPASCRIFHPNPKAPNPKVLGSVVVQGSAYLVTM